MISKTLLFLALLCFSLSIVAQTDSDSKLAQYYYENGEFDKALTYYEKIYDNNQSKLIFNRYVDCLLQTKDIKKAEKTIKKQISLNQKDLSLQLQLGSFYELNDEASKSKKVYNEVIDQAAKNPTSVTEVFRILLKENKTDLAKDILSLIQLFLH